MNELIERLLKPISAEQPCGPDLSYDPRFENLETILKGKPEVDVEAVRTILFDVAGPEGREDVMNMQGRSSERSDEGRPLVYGDRRRREP